MAPSPANPSASPAAATGPQAIILAAGKGTRMAQATDGQPADDRDVPPKVLYPVADRPMIYWVVRACREAGVQRCILVIGYKGERVRAALADQPDCEYVEQRQQLGTGHAAMMAEPLFTDQPATDVYVLAGDGPLIRPKTLRQLLDAHRATRAAATLATAVLDDPTGYGRVLREPDGSLQAIVEQKDATPDERQVREINPSYYCFRSDQLFSALHRVRPHNKQGEYYITDVPTILKKDGRVVTVVDAVPPDDVHSVNTPEQLALVDRILRARLSGEPEKKPSTSKSPLAQPAPAARPAMEGKR